MKSDNKKMFPSIIPARLFSTLLIVLLAIGFLPVQSMSAEGDPLESYPYQHVLPGRQHAKSIAVDPAGYVIIGGSTLDDFLTVKVKADGSAKLWEKTFDLNSGVDHLEASAVDSNGDVIVTGYASKGVGNLSDIITIKYDGTDGTVLWQATYNNTDNNGNDFPFAMAVDSLNNIYIAGKTQGGGGDDDGLLLKYSPNGGNPDGSPIWVKTYDGSGSALNDQWASVAAGTNSVAVTGKTDSGSANFDIVTMLYNLDSTDGWLSPVVFDSGFASDSGLLVKMDSNDNVVIAAISGTNSGDFYTVKYSNADGSIDTGWSTAKTYDGGSIDQPRGLWIDGNDDIYITGSTFIGASTDYYTIRYNGTDGSTPWGAGSIFNSGTDQSDIPVGIVVDDTGDVFVTGYSVISGTNHDFTTLKYKKDDGTQLWTPPDGVFSGVAGKLDQPLGMGLASTGELFVGGWTDTASNDYDFVAIKYDPGNLNLPTALSVTTVSNTAVDLSWTDNSSNESGFKIFRKKASDLDFTEIDTVGANITIYNDTGLTAHVWYTYKVQAYITSPAAVSHFSNEANVLTTAVSYDTPTWTYQYNSADNGEDYAYAIAVGPDDEPVATGTHQPGIAPASVSFDYYTVKMNRFDASKIWDATYDDADESLDIAECITVDTNNDVVVSGFSNLPWGANPNTNDIYTRKYLSTGPDHGPPNYGDPFVWSAQYNGPGNDDDRSEAIDASSDGNNNVVVTGYGKNVRGEDDIYLIKYDAPGDGLGEGNVLWAATPYDGGGNDYPAAVIFDQNGDVLITGQSYLNGNVDIFTRKVDGSNGNTIWTAIYNGVGDGYDAGYSLAVDNNGDVYVTGPTTNGSGNLDWYIVKYDGDVPGPNGVILWSKTHNGPANGEDVPESIKVDQNDNAVVIGGTVLQSAGNNDFHVRRYLSDGTPDWDKTLERVDNDDNATTMGMDVSGNVCLAGNTDDDDSIDLLAIKYDYVGNILGSTLYDGVDDTDAHAMAVNSVGDQFIAGYTTPRLNLDSDFLVVKCMGDVLQSPSPVTAVVHYTSVDFNWVDNTSDEDGFYLERKTGDCASVDWDAGDNLIYTAAPGATSYTDEGGIGGLNIGSTYCYRLQTFKNSGATSRWIEKEVTTTTPLPPDGLQASVLNTTDIKLLWNDTTSTENGFTILRCTGTDCDPETDSTPEEVFLIPSGSTSFVDTTGCYNTIYNYSINAYRTNKWSTAYAHFAANLQTNTLAPPTSLIKTDFAQTTVSLEWDDNSDDETSYTIQRCDAATWTCGATPSQEFSLTMANGNTMLLRMDEAAWSGNPAVDAAVDVSGNNNHGTIYGSANTGAEGKYDRRAELDGTNDYIGTSLDIDQSATSAGVTMMAWVYPLTTSANKHYLFSTENGSVGSENYNWGVHRNGADWFVDTGSTTTDTTVNATANQWQHIAVVFDPTGIRFYLNGAETAMAVPGNHDTAQAFTIGRRGALNQEFFDGYLDEVAVYDRPLSAAQVNALMNRRTFEAGKARYDDTTVAYNLNYTYRVRAEKTTDASCTWDPDPTDDIYINTLPPPPTDFLAIAVDSTKVIIDWTDNTAGEDNFTLERCEGSGIACDEDAEFSTVVSTTIAPDTQTYTDNSACGETTYNYRVKGTDAVWTATLPSTVSQTTTDVKGITPTNLTITDIWEEQAELEWNYLATDLTEFKVGVCADSPGPCVDPVDFTVTTQAPLPSGVLARWQFDEPDWENGRPVLDSSGNGNHGTAYKGVTTENPGKFGYGAAVLDGSSQYITTPLNIDQTNSSSQITMEAWVYPTSTSNTWKHVISTENTNSDDNWGIAQYGSTWRFQTGNTNINTPITLNDWNHLVVVYDPSASPPIKAYKNGVLATSYSSIYYTSSDRNVTIGRRAYTNDYHFPGKIDEVIIYNRALSLAEVQDRAWNRTRHTINGLTPNTLYNFRVWAYKNAFCPWDGPTTETAMSTDNIAVMSPTNFTHSKVDTTQVDLTWDDIASSETGYQIQRCLGTGTDCDEDSEFSDLFTVAEDITSYSDTTACNGLTYTYRVQAEGATWESAWAYHAVTTVTAVAPSLTVSVVSESELDISWTDTNEDEDQFVLERCTGSPVDEADGVGQSSCDEGVEFDTPIFDMNHVYGKLLHYRMDEAFWSNQNGDVIDISGNAKHGRPYNNATTVAAGKYDRAGDFNGSTHFISTTLDIDQNSSSSPGVTMEAWVRPTVNDSNYRFIVSTDEGNNDWGVLIRSNVFWISNGTNLLTTGITATQDDWQHVAAVFDPAAGNVKFYKNGTESATVAGLSYDTTDNNFTVGRRGAYTTASYYFQGQIDEVVVYNHPLTQAEITNHATVKIDQVSYSDTGLIPGTYYTYRLQVIKPSPTCGSGYWNTEDIAYDTTSMPPAPTGLAAGGDTNTVELTWNDNSGSETDYTLERCAGTCAIDGDFTDLVVPLGADIESYSDTSVCPGQTFTYRVRAERDAGPPWVTTWNGPVTWLVPTPQVPSGLNYSKISEVQINLGWTDETTDESGFKIEQCMGASCPASGTKNYFSVGADVTTYQAIGLTPDQTYTFRVQAEKASAACGWPTAYSPAEITDTFAYVSTDLGGSATSTTDVEICWTDNTDSETGTEIWRCDDPPGCAGGYTLIATVGPDETCFTDITTCNNQQYSYQVKAVGSGLSNSGGGCWTKKAPITFANGFQANSPVELVIPYATYAPDMQSDFKDIRFFDATAKQELTSYWFADKVDGNTARFWLMTGDYDNIYIYYGNASALDSSGTDLLFTEIYDDFEGAGIDPDKWEEIDPDNNIVQTGNGNLTFNYGNNSWTRAVISAKTFERAVGNEVIFDLTTGSSRRGQIVLGWLRDQTASTNPNQMMHGINFFGNKYYYNTKFHIYENGVGEWPPGEYKYFWENIRYQVKTVLKDVGAKHYVVGGLYPDWTLIHETSTNSDTSLRISILHPRRNVYVHSVTVKHASAQRGAVIGAIEDVATCTGDFNIWESGHNDNGPITIPTANVDDPDTMELTVMSDTSVDLSWNSNTTDESGFKIERCLDTGSGCTFIQHDTTGPGVTTYTDTSLPASATVSYLVKAYKTTSDCNWTSGPSNAPTVVLASSSPSGPDTPTELKVTPLNSFKMQLEWIDNGIDEEGYEVEIQIFNGSYTNIAVLGPDSQIYVDTKVEPNKTYFYRVRSFRGTTTSSWLTGSGTTPPWLDGDSTDTCDP